MPDYNGPRYFSEEPGGLLPGNLRALQERVVPRSLSIPCNLSLKVALLPTLINLWREKSNRAKSARLRVG
jgi:hypothetical protein